MLDIIHVKDVMVLEQLVQRIALVAMVLDLKLKFSTALPAMEEGTYGTPMEINKNVQHVMAQKKL